LALKFCKLCNNILIRQRNGTLICKNGHIEEDSVTKDREKVYKKRKRIIKESNESLIKKGIVFRLIRPVKIRPPSFAQEPDAYYISAETPRFYEHLKRIEQDYSGSLLRKKGNLFTGEIPYIICLRSIASIVSSGIEEFKLSDGTSWHLEEVQIDEEERRRIFNVY